MRGNVEVFAIASDGSENLIAKGDNLVVDGAGKTLVDMFTLPAQTSAITPAITDASNWCIKGLSFGPAGGSFGSDAGRATTLCFGETEASVIGTTAYYVTPEAIADSTSWVNVDRSVTAAATNQRIVRALYNSNSELWDTDEATTSSFIPPHRLPSYPDPLDTQLEPCSVAYVDVSADGTTSNGQFQNKIYYNINDPSAYLFGAYAVGYEAAPGHASGDFMIMAVNSLEGNFAADNDLNIVGSGLEVGSTNSYNGRGEVDSDGFIRVVPVQNSDSEIGAAAMFGGSWDPDSEDAHWLGRAWVSGVGAQTSATAFCDADGAGKIMVTTRIHNDDMRMFNMYGGLHQVGLWTYNMKSILDTSTPPYEWGLDDDGDCVLEYNLFAKKTFTENLSSSRDKASGYFPGMNYTGQHLLLRWTLDFRTDIP